MPGDLLASYLTDHLAGATLGTRRMRRLAEHERAAPDAVGEGAHGHEQPGEHERVDVDDPQELRPGGPQRLGDLGQREAEHRVVDRHEQHGEHEHREREPPPRRTGLRCGGRALQARGMRELGR